MDLIAHLLLAGLLFGFSPYIILGTLLPDLFFFINHIQKLLSKKGFREYKKIKSLVKGEKDDFINKGFLHDLGGISNSIGVILILITLSYLLKKMEFTLFVYAYVLHSTIDMLVHKKSGMKNYFWPFNIDTSKKEIGIFQWNFSGLHLIVLSYLIMGLAYSVKFMFIPNITVVSTFFSIYGYAVWFIFPAYIANTFPVLVSKINLFNKPIDFGKKIGGKRIFGDHKTWRGFFFAIFYGWVIGFLQNRSLIGFILALGAMLGDLTVSFIKRRFNIKSGDKLFLADQLNSLAGALFLSYIFGFLNLDIYQIIFLIFFTIIIHYASSLIGYKIRLKKNPW